MFTFDRATELHQKFVEFYERGRITCALCHGLAILRHAKLRNGQFLAKGKTVTGFANVEEDFADDTVWSMNLLPRDKHVMPEFFIHSAFSRVWEKTAFGFSFIAVAIGPSDAAQCGPMIS